MNVIILFIIISILLIIDCVLFLYCIKASKDGHGFQCFHCLHNSLVWQCDYDFEDYGYEGDGIVQVLVCSNCGAEVEYKIYFDDNE